MALGGPAAAETNSAYTDDDIWLIENSTQDSLENAKTNQATVWKNPDTGSTGTITPIETYQNADGQYCREYQKTVTIGGEEQQAYGTACRMPDGTWQLVRSETAVEQLPPAPQPTVIYRDRVVYQPVYRPVPQPYYDPWRPLYGYPVIPLALNLGFSYYDDDWGIRLGGHSGGYWRGHAGGYWRGHRGRHWRGHGGGHRRAHHHRRGHHRRWRY
jgi:surface antigen